MRIACFVLWHIDPKHIRRLTDKIANSIGDEAFVHVDGKCGVEPFEQALKAN